MKSFSLLMTFFLLSSCAHQMFSGSRTTASTNDNEESAKSACAEVSPDKVNPNDSLITFLECRQTSGKYTEQNQNICLKMEQYQLPDSRNHVGYINQLTDNIIADYQIYPGSEVRTSTVRQFEGYLQKPGFFTPKILKTHHCVMAGGQKCHLLSCQDACYKWVEAEVNSSTWEIKTKYLTLWDWKKNDFIPVSERPVEDLRAYACKVYHRVDDRRSN
ncbi:MAG: hypothetical protein WC635_06570 [Bacteriovorax sp.]|jgi:hypothetical protein